MINGSLYSKREGNIGDVLYREQIGKLVCVLTISTLLWLNPLNSRRYRHFVNFKSTAFTSNTHSVILAIFH